MPTGEVHRFPKPTGLLIGAALFLLVLWTFFPAVRNGFLTYDDPEYVTSNPHVQSGLTLAGFKWAFEAHGAHWHPLTCLSHMLDGQLFGMRPWGHHFDSVCLHAANALLAFWVLRQLTGATGRSFAVALLFGLHPLRVESVAWVSERKDVLSTFFWLLTLLAYAEYASRSKAQAPRTKLFYAAALLAFALGLLSKSMLVTLPFALLLLDYWPLRRFQEKTALYLALEKLPFLLVAGGMSVVAYFAQVQGTALVSGLSFKTRIENALISYCRYLAKLFWPENLSALYPYPPFWPLAMVCGAALLLAMLSITAILSLRQRPYLAVGWFWFLGTLVPVIGLVQAGEQAMADRYSYVPSLGIFIALVWLAGELTKNWRWQFAAAATTLTALGGVCFMLTREQIGYWKNTETVFQHAVATTRDNTLADVGLGECLAERGDYAEAIPLYRRAIQISPGYYDAHYNLGLALLATGAVDDAVAEFQRATKCRSGVPENYINLGAAFARQGKLPEATAQLEQAVALDPANALAHSDLGKLLLQAKNLGRAASEFKLALGLEPDNAELHNDLGTALAMDGQLGPAIAEFQQALKLDPNHIQARENLDRARRLNSLLETGPKVR